MSRKQIISEIITQPHTTTLSSPLTQLDNNLCVGSPPFVAASAAQEPRFFCLRQRLRSADAAALTRAQVRSKPGVLPAINMNVQQPHLPWIFFFFWRGDEGGSVAEASGGSHTVQ